MGGFEPEKGREIRENFLEPLWERLNSDSHFYDKMENITKLKLLPMGTYEKLSAGRGYSAAFRGYLGRVFEIYVRRTLSEMSDEIGSLHPCTVNGAVMPGVDAYTSIHGNVIFQKSTVNPGGSVQTNAIAELDGLYMFNRDTPVIVEVKSSAGNPSGYMRKSDLVRKLYGRDTLFLKVMRENGSNKNIMYNGGGFATVMSHVIDMKMIKKGLDSQVPRMPLSDFK